MRARLTSTVFKASVVVALATTFMAGCGTVDPAFTTPEPVEETAASPTGRILFVAGGAVNQWDGDVSRVTDNEEVVAASPTWAPRGDRFAYVAMSDGYSDIVVADADGDLLKQVTNNKPEDPLYSEEFASNAAWAFDPEWSPVADELIFVSDSGGLNPFADPLYMWYSERFDIDLAPYPLDAAVALDVMQEDPSFAPSGDRVAFVVREDSSETRRVTEIWTIDLNTGEASELVTSPGGAYDPDWSPDGRNIAYIQRDGTSNDVWIAPADGGESYRLTSVGVCVSPVWSPDGSFIAFFRERGGSFEAWYVEVSAGADGKLAASEPQKLFSADAIDAASGMSWIPK